MISVLAQLNARISFHRSLCILSYISYVMSMVLLCYTHAATIESHVIYNRYKISSCRRRMAYLAGG